MFSEYAWLTRIMKTYAISILDDASTEASRVDFVVFCFVCCTCTKFGTVDDFCFLDFGFSILIEPPEKRTQKKINSTYLVNIGGSGRRDLHPIAKINKVFICTLLLFSNQTISVKICQEFL